ncbi:MAG: 4Fe-4S binding protein [Lachnospiraceae bacterium]|nr:4Fe-4S binding protein [Lachnospiraceae bacterium]
MFVWSVSGLGDKKKGTIRHWFQAGWFAFTNGYLRGYTSGKIFTGNTKALCVPGLNCYSCPGAVGACPIGSLQAVLGSPSYKISLYVFGFLAMFGVLFGRLVCGWMCPFGLFQDLLYKIKVKGKKKNLPGHKYLRYLKYIILVLMVIILPMFIVNSSGMGQPWFCEWICPSGILLGGIPLTILNEGLREAIGARFIWKLIVLILIIIGSIWFYRPFCKYLCPLGAIYGFFNPVSGYRLVVDKDKCIKCGACQKACGMDIKTWENPNSVECIRCGDCMRACPKGAIESTWAKVRAHAVSKCFVDDTVIEKSENAASKKYAVFGALCVIEGAVAGYITIVSGLIRQAMLRVEMTVYNDLGYYAFIPPIMNTAAAMIILVTGLYVLVHRNENFDGKGITHKLLIGYISFLLTIAAYLIIGLAGGSETLGRCIAINLYAVMGAMIIMIVTPLLMAMSDNLRVSSGKDETKTAGRNQGFVILSVICVILLLLAVFIHYAFNS